LIPGAQVKDGNIVPAKIEANIVADEAGPAYNLGPISKLTIPGFKGTPKYNGFYGVFDQPTTGGFVGQKPVPTEEDIKNAKSKIVDILTTSLKNNFLANYPQDFKILDGASEINIARLSVNENMDANGNFSVFAEGNMRAVAFKEADIKSLLNSLATKDNPVLVFGELKLDYSLVTADFKEGKLSFFLSAQGVLKPDFSADDFKSKILSQKVEDVRLLIAGLQGLSDARVSVWPIWLRRLPSRPNHIQVLVN